VDFFLECVSICLNPTELLIKQGAKKVVSHSLGLVDFSFTLIEVFGQIFVEIQITESYKGSNLWGGGGGGGLLVIMTLRLHVVNNNIIIL